MLVVMTRVVVLLVGVSGVVFSFDPAGYRWAGAAGIGAVLLLALLRVRSVLRRRSQRRSVEGLRRLPPHDFEQEVGRWLKREGWRVEQRGGTGDGGIDLLATRGRETLAVQCKRYAESATVTAAQVRDLYGAAIASGSTRAALVTTGRISRAAVAWCEELPAGLRMHLVDSEAVGRFATGQWRLGA